MVMKKVGTQLATGGRSSITVMMIEQEPKFPLPSSATMLILLAPRSAQVKVDVNEIFGVPQLSDFEETTSDSVIVADPPLSRLMEKSGLQVTEGEIASMMVTGMVQVDLLLPSSAVTVIRLVPLFAQVKVDVKKIVGGPQLSLLEETRSDSKTIAVPEVSRLVEKEDLQMTLGGMLSLTVIELEQLDVCP